MTEDRAPARTHNHVCREVASRETPNSTNVIALQDREKKAPLSLFVSPRNHECHGAPGLSFDPKSYGAGLAGLAKREAFAAIRQRTPTRFDDGSKFPFGLWRDLVEAAQQAYRQARRLARTADR